MREQNEQLALERQQAEDKARLEARRRAELAAALERESQSSRAEHEESRGDASQTTADSATQQQQPPAAPVETVVVKVEYRADPRQEEELRRLRDLLDMQASQQHQSRRRSSSDSSTHEVAPMSLEEELGFIETVNAPPVQETLQSVNVLMHMHDGETLVGPSQAALNAELDEQQRRMEELRRQVEELEARRQLLLEAPQAQEPTVDMSAVALKEEESDKAFEQLCQQFGNIDRDTVKAVYDAREHNVPATEIELHTMQSVSFNPFAAPEEEVSQPAPKVEMSSSERVKARQQELLRKKKERASLSAASGSPVLAAKPEPEPQPPPPLPPKRIVVKPASVPTSSPLVEPVAIKAPPQAAVPKRADAAYEEILPEVQWKPIERGRQAPKDEFNFTPLWGDANVFPLLHGLKKKGTFEVVLPGQEKLYRIKLGTTPMAAKLGLNSRFDALCLLKVTPTFISLLTQKSNEPIAEWPMYYIRNIQAAPEQLRLEVWESGGKASNMFLLISLDSEVIFHFIRKAMNDYIVRSSNLIFNTYIIIAFQAKKDSEIVQIMQRDELQRSGKVVSEAQVQEELEKVLRQCTYVQF